MCGADLQVCVVGQRRVPPSAGPAPTKLSRRPTQSTSEYRAKILGLAGCYRECEKDGPNRRPIQEAKAACNITSSIRPVCPAAIRTDTKAAEEPVPCTCDHDQAHIAAALRKMRKTDLLNTRLLYRIFRHGSPAECADGSMSHLREPSMEPVVPPSSSCMPPGLLLLLNCGIYAGFI